MGHGSSSLLHRIPSEVLDLIAVLAVDQLGPPRELATHLLICKAITTRLSLHDVGARIFRYKFDTTAPERRYPDAAMYPRNLFMQLKSYCTTLKVIRKGDIFVPDIEDHLWNCFFLLQENDGLNAMQLVLWAGIRDFIDLFVRTRLHEGKQTNHDWPLETPVNSLAMYILWATSDYEAVLSESASRRQQLMDLVRPYVVNPVRYPVFHVPDAHFNVPIDRMYMGQFPFTVATAHGPYPPYRDEHTVVVKRTHFTIQHTLMPPLISLSARLVYFSRSEATPVVPQDDVPENRQHAIALGQNWVRPTRVDLNEFNEQRAAKPPPLGPWDFSDQHPKNIDELLSLQFDSDFQRLVDCTNPFSCSPMAPYVLGSMTGDYAGRMLIPDTTQNTEMLNQALYAPGTPVMAIAPFYARFTEWQCVDPQPPVPEGGQGSSLWDDGVRNAWFPEVLFHIHEDTIRIADRHNSNLVYCYEKFVPGRPNSHDPTTCRNCLARAALEARIEEERVQQILRQRESLVESEDEGDEMDVEVMDESPTPVLVSVGLPSSVPDDLPVPEDPLHPRFVRTEIVDDNGGQRIIEPELDEVVGEDEDMEDTDDESFDGDIEDDSSPFEYDTCAGVRDIIITGQTISRHADAWHDYVFYGRVRKHDGLITLVRKPVVFQGFGVQIFRGYLMGSKTLVGNWRSFRPNPAELAQEGPFVATRTDFGV